MTEAFQTMVSFFTKGGLFMWPLLACSIVTVTTIVLSILTLRERKVLPLVIESEIERLVPGGVLLLGHAESLLNVSTAFELLHLKDDLVYRKPVSARDANPALDSPT